MARHGIKSIAARAGVSTATVSLALKDDPRVADKTKAKIKELVDELGYIPNNFGRALQGDKSLLIGFFAPHIDVSYFNEILQGSGEIASEKDYGLLVATPSGGDEEQIRQLKIFQSKRVDGVIATGCYPGATRTLLDINENGTPVIFVSTPLSGESLLPVVKNDDLKTGEIAAEHLISLGHKKLAYCFSKMTNERYQSSLEYCMRNGITDYRRMENESELAELLGSAQRPTGIIAYSDEHAIKVVEVARKAGLQVPKDLSVIGVDDTPFASLPVYSLTTIAPQKKNIGRRAVETLIDMIAGEKKESIFLEPKLIARESTKPPRNK